MRHDAQEGFIISSADISNDILIPRFYDPRIEEQLTELSPTHHHFSIDDLVTRSFILHDHGSYVPKIHYGTGVIPYLRTSDLANWETKASPKHGVSQEIFDEYGPSQDVRPEDIFFVHEGTYLIGAVAMTTSFDGPALYQHHLAKFRVLKAAPFAPYFLLAAFESPVVQRQIRSKQFSADIIDSVVGRLGQVIIPVPKDSRKLGKIEADGRDALSLHPSNQ
jgi:type I restriction enzyme M protein